MYPVIEVPEDAADSTEQLGTKPKFWFRPLLYSKPEPNKKNEVDLLFLCHGIEHLPKNASDRVGALKAEETLFPMFDVRNPYDPHALAIRTGDPRYLIGYVPRFFIRQLRKCNRINETGRC